MKALESAELNVAVEVTQVMTELRMVRRTVSHNPVYLIRIIEKSSGGSCQ